MKRGEAKLPTTTGSRRRLALRRPCLRRARAVHGSEIQVKQGLLFVALVLVLLAQAQDFLEDFHIEALSLGLSVDFLLALIQSYAGNWVTV